MLKCSNCNSNWLEHGNQWERNDGKIDYRCGVCGIKRKPWDVKSEDYQWEANRKINELKSYVGSNSRTKRILALGDMHCGHKAGLTPPEWWVNPYHKKEYNLMKECWEFYKETISKIGHVDAVIVNADCIDGKGTRSGGTELITTDQLEQVEIAKKCLEQIDSDKFFFTRGTPYHTSAGGEDYEDKLADDMNGIIKDHLWLDINGCVFDVKHKVGGSTIPHGRATSLMKEYVWNSEWAKMNGAPVGHIFLRSHVHYNIVVQDPTNYLCMTLPALQAADTKFGARQCSGTVHFGMVLFEVPGDYKDVDDVNFTVFRKKLESIESKSIKV